VEEVYRKGMVHVGRENVRGRVARQKGRWWPVEVQKRWWQRSPSACRPAAAETAALKCKRPTIEKEKCSLHKEVYIAEAVARRQRPCPRMHALQAVEGRNGAAWGKHASPCLQKSSQKRPASAACTH